MKLLPLIILALCLSLSAAGQATQPVRSPVMVGVDKQPPSQFAWVKGLGADTLHRYENGPQKNITLRQWLTAAREQGLKAMVEGVELDAQGWDLAKEFADVIVCVSLPDEPDINRAASGNTKLFYTKDDAPHQSMIGWTRYEVSEDQFARWSKLTNLPILVNFAGAKINDGYYAAPLDKHARYIRASHWQTFDVYPVQEKGDAGHLYWLGNIIDKINATPGGNCVGAYLECSYGGKPYIRGATPNEQSIMFWSIIAHGGKQIHYFPQRVGNPFSYNAMLPENEAQARVDNALLFKYREVIERGTITRAAFRFENGVPVLPAVKNSMYTKPVNTLVWPDTEVAEIVHDQKKLTIRLDYKGRTSPVIEYTDTTLPPATQPSPESQRIAALEAARAEDRKAIDAAEAKAADAKATADAIKAALKAIGN